MDHTLILQNIGRYIKLDKEEEDHFLSILRPKTIKRKEFLLREGEVCRYESFVLKGCMRTYSLDNQGNEHIVMFAIEDWWTADLYSFLTETPATFSIDALEDTDVVQISKSNLESLYEKVPKFERFFRILFQNAYVAQQQRIKQNLSFTAEERYRHFVSKYPKVEQRVSQKQVASFLGITPEFLSILRKKIVT